MKFWKSDMIKKKENTLTMKLRLQKRSTEKK